MQRLLLRIALNAGLAAVLLAAMGFMYAKVAATMLPLAKPGEPEQAQGLAADELRTRIPLMMALGGFVFVALGEALLYLVRGHPREAKPEAPKTDEAEKLLEELLKHVEDAEKAKNAGTQPGEKEA